jgi:hypothetical protein
VQLQINQLQQEMVDAETRLKWKKFVHLGKNIHDMDNYWKMDQARKAFIWAAELVEDEYILQSKERYELFKKHFNTIVEYLDEDEDPVGR